MPLKDLLVCVDQTDAGKARLRLALGLARANRAHLVGVYALPDAPAEPITAVGFGVDAPSHQAEAAETWEHHFESELRLNGVDGKWHLLPDGDLTALIELGKSVDLTITGQIPPGLRANGAARFRPEDIVLATGRPALIIPYAGDFATVGRRALIAWDGTREANRALND